MKRHEFRKICEALGFRTVHVPERQRGPFTRKYVAMRDASGHSLREGAIVLYAETVLWKTTFRFQSLFPNPLGLDLPLHVPFTHVTHRLFTEPWMKLLEHHWFLELRTRQRSGLEAVASYFSMLLSQLTLESAMDEEEYLIRTVRSSASFRIQPPRDEGQVCWWDGRMVRVRALRRLAQIDSEKAHAVLLMALKEPEVAVRSTALNALSTDDPRSARMVVRALAWKFIEPSRYFDGSVRAFLISAGLEDRATTFDAMMGGAFRSNADEDIIAGLQDIVRSGTGLEQQRAQEILAERDNLPRPATSPPNADDSLPRPVSGTPIETDDLPRASADEADG